MRTRLNIEERKERRRRVVARSKFALPSTITLISVLCGFSSVVMSINAAGDHPRYYFTWGAALLVLAGVFDGLDGREPRPTNTATEFGVQLDSLADVLSFGMAPAILAYRYGFFQLGIADPQLRAVGWAASFFFIACGALRLARFNVQVGYVDSRFFVGMPIPVGAACVASVILVWPSSPTAALQAYLFAAGLFLVGVLMVSGVRFPSFKKRSHSPYATHWLTLAVLGMLCLLVILRQNFFLPFCTLYLLITLAMNIAWRLGWRGIEPPLRARKAEPTETEAS
ncbi:MAG: CDP-diacylglycerol--serine O-phosphatidyltransferase [Holophaga sp.]|nr:CDP-diacylglycerol--serine O-phosphatidyltransferase [Holophaga sp.]